MPKLEIHLEPKRRMLGKLLRMLELYQTVTDKKYNIEGELHEGLDKIVWGKNQIYISLEIEREHEH